MKTVHCLGPIGSYSHIIAKKMYPKLYISTCESFYAVVDTVLNADDAIGLLPVENSITSDVHENIDHLFSQDIHIIGEGYLVIHLHLIGLLQASFDDITSVYSHPKALAQATTYIKRHGISTFETKSTAEGKNIVIAKNDIRKACIGSQELVADGQLKIIAEDIGNYKNNMTRFLVISQKDTVQKNHDEMSSCKGSYIFTLQHSPGILARLLTKLSSLNVNLSKIESRPLPGTQWEYQFLVDLEMAPRQVEGVAQIFSENTTHMKNVGIYGRGKIYDS